jgi:hypothetical protein
VSGRVVCTGRWQQAAFAVQASLGLRLTHVTSAPQLLRPSPGCLTNVLQNGVYGKALPSYVPAAVSHESAAASPAGSTANVDTYLVEPSGGLETTSMPGGVARIVDGTRKLFEV